MENKNPYSYFNYLIIFLLLSLIFHLGTYFILPKLELILSNAATTPIEVVYNSESKKTGQIVTDPDLGEILKEVQDASKYLSQYNRRVKDQMIARRKGETKNKTLSINEEKEPQQKEKLNSNSHPKSLNGNVLDPLKFKPNDDKNYAKDLKNNFFKKQSMPIGESSISEYIPFVKEGSFTSLNTDQISYYTFFSRIHEQIRPRWVRGVQSASTFLNSDVLLSISRKTQVTEVEVIINSQGDIVKINLIKASEFSPLNQAVINSFNDAAPFLNPPAEMADPSGQIHLYYSFRVQWDPSFIVNSR